LTFNLSGTESGIVLKMRFLIVYCLLIKQGSTVYVEAVAEHHQRNLIYLVLGGWYPYRYFRA